MNDRKGVPYGDSGVDGVTPTPQRVDTYLRGEMFSGDDHGMAR